MTAMFTLFVEDVWDLGWGRVLHIQHGVGKECIIEFSKSLIILHKSRTEQCQRHSLRRSHLPQRLSLSVGVMLGIAVLASSAETVGTNRSGHASVSYL